MAADAVERELDDLYAAPLDEFTRRRDALARSLQQADGERGAAIKRLKRPSNAAWALNRVAHAEPTMVKRFVERARELHDAQLRGGREIAGALAAQRQSGAAILDRAQAELREARGGTSDALRRKLATTLQAAAADPELSEALLRGRLTADAEAPGFAAFAADAPAKPAKTRDTGAVDAARSAVQAAKETRREREREARVAQREADRLSGQAASAQAAADAAAEALREADEELRRAEEALAELRR